MYSCGISTVPDITSSKKGITYISELKLNYRDIQEAVGQLIVQKYQHLKDTDECKLQVILPKSAERPIDPNFIKYLFNFNITILFY